jgi:hypothetical protein
VVRFASRLSASHRGATLEIMKWRHKFIGPLALIAFGLATAYLCAGQSPPRSDSCDRALKKTSPKFRIARRSQNAARHALVLWVSVAPHDVAEDKLLSLGCKLGSDYANEQVLVVWIFDTDAAAKRFNPQGEGNDAATSLALRGSYYFSRENKDQSLGWFPDPRDHSRHIEIKLGPPSPNPPL